MVSLSIVPLSYRSIRMFSSEVVIDLTRLFSLSASTFGIGIFCPFSGCVIVDWSSFWDATDSSFILSAGFAVTTGLFSLVAGLFFGGFVFATSFFTGAGTGFFVTPVVTGGFCDCWVLGFKGTGLVTRLSFLFGVVLGWLKTGLLAAGAFALSFTVSAGFLPVRKSSFLKSEVATLSRYTLPLPQ